MRVLLDTNILTRSAQREHSQHSAAIESVRALRSRGDLLFVVPQTLYEFWVVATRPAGENGLERTPAETAERLAQIKRSYTLLVDRPELFNTGGCQDSCRLNENAMRSFLAAPYQD